MLKTISRAFALILALAIVLSGVSFAFAETKNFEINSTSDFIEFAGLCRLDSFSRGLKVSLNCDIDLAGYDFSGIPSFSGTFNGNGHRVTNYKLDTVDDISGLFIYIEKGGIVNDLNVTGDIRSSSKSCTGGLVAVNAGTVNNCSFRGSLISAGEAGGIAGHNGSGGIISACINYANVVSQENVGGIVGDNDGSIVSCMNLGDVNNSSSWVDESNTISLAELANYEIDIDSGRNIGGIAGYNLGTIESCSNSATVGYLNSGINVGGIAGYTEGKIISSVNEGAVFGKTNTAGIAGHMQPYIVEDAAENLRPQINTVHDWTEKMINDVSSLGDTLDSDVDELTDNVDAAVDTANSISHELTRVVNNDSSSVNDEVSAITAANDSLTAAINKVTTATDHIEKTLTDADGNTKSPLELTQSDIDSVRKDISAINSALKDIKSAVQYLNSETKSFSLDTFSSSFSRNLDKLESELNAVTASLDKLSKDLNSQSKTVEQDARNINDSVNSLLNSALDTYEKLEDMFRNGDVYKDRSVKDPNNKNASLIRSCENFGPVKGQSNTGGIAGDTDVEILTAAKSDSLNVGRTYFVYAVIDGCTNKGYVSGGKSNTGGIAGYNNYSLIENCLASGCIASPSADYVGGVAGLSYAYIKDSYSLSVIEGKKYVGGIAGDGNEIHGCLSLATINEYESQAGSISGSDLNHKEADITSYRAGMAKRITDNYYCSSNLFGIAGASYQGIAEPLSYDELCKKKNAPDEFKNLRLYFMDPEGFIISEQPVSYGQILDDIQYPVASVGESYVRWHGLYSEAVFGNVVLIAEEEDSITVLSSTEKAENRSIALAEGEFTDASSLSAKASDLDTSSVNEKDAVLKTYSLRISDAKIGKNSATKMRIYCGDCADAKIYLHDAGGWYEVPSEKIGRYLAFEITGDSADVCVVTRENRMAELNTSGILLPVAVIIVITVIIVIAVVVHKKKAKKKNENIGAVKNK